VCPGHCAAAANTAFFGRGGRIRWRDRGHAPGNSAKKRRIQVVNGVSHAAARADKAAIAGGVCPMDAVGAQGIPN
jgi:hypothetical protein